MPARRPPGGGNPRPRNKTALAHVGGRVHVAGDREVGARLSYALDVGEVERDVLTHGFHSYPARMHWATAARCIEVFGSEGARLLDPFAGSGTTLVEARIAGLAATGIDLNPLAVRLGRLKCDPLDEARRAALLEAALAAAERSEERVRARVAVRANLPPDEARWYQPHVLKEMAGLFEEIQALPDENLRERLTLVFSALIVKFSKQRSDTSQDEVARRLRKGLVTEFFVRKTRELCARLTDLEAEVRGPFPRLVLGDAREAARELSGRFDLVVTSPPYGGTYDYVAHHQRRFAWLGIDPRYFGSREIGARRRDGGPQRFFQEMAQTLDALYRVTADGALVLMLMGDARYDEQTVPADELVAEAAEATGFFPLSVASQERPDFAGGPPRREHLMALARR